ncbi:hypothetical protein PR048_019141 [Dryococelus australis]|uniref:Uncharacterized protein n=1 Tax=Dryococelus australis TaxID=614101 RepID=A0ABQ9H2N8_9NEOP|nr:hypothetical protein PR048_019141 [Dryococelus australis]
MEGVTEITHINFEGATNTLELTSTNTEQQNVVACPSQEYTTPDQLSSGMRIVLQTVMAKITSSQEDTKRDIESAKSEHDARMETMVANLTSGMANITRNLRAKLHAERSYPGKRKTFEEHLSEVYDKSRHLTLPVSNEEFAAIILHQLPYKYQTHWSGRMDQDVASFREGLLELSRIERLQRSQLNRDGDRNNPADKPPPLYTDQSRPPFRPPQYRSNQGPRVNQFQCRYSQPYSVPGQHFQQRGQNYHRGRRYYYGRKNSRRRGEHDEKITDGVGRWQKK